MTSAVKTPKYQIMYLVLHNKHSSRLTGNVLNNIDQGGSSLAGDGVNWASNSGSQSASHESQMGPNFSKTLPHVDSHGAWVRRLNPLLPRRRKDMLKEVDIPMAVY